MRLNSYDALTAFAKQLERHVSGGSFKTKVIVTPSSIDEQGVVIKVSLLKTFAQQQPPAARSSRTLRVRVTVSGSAISMTGFRQAVEAVEALDEFFLKDCLRLEAADAAGVVRGVPNSRIVQYISEEDSFIDSPDKTTVQDVQDDRIILITIPRGGD